MTLSVSDVPGTTGTDNSGLISRAPFPEPGQAMHPLLGILAGISLVDS